MTSARDPLLEPQQRELRALRVLRERWYIVALVAAACLAGALAIALKSTKQYQATSKLLFQDDSFGAVLFNNNAFQGTNDPTRNSQTNVDTVSSLDVATAVKSALRLHQSPQDLLKQMNATAEPNADIVDITYQDPDPARAAQIANAWASQYIYLRQQQARAKVGQAIADMKAKLSALPPDQTANRAQYAQQLSKLQALQAVQFGNVQLSESAPVPKSPVSPKPKQDAALGLVLGLVLGVGLALLLDALDRRIKTVDALENAYERPVIGLVPERAIKPRSEADRRKSIEAFRAVREGLAVFTVTKSSPVFVVTSAVSAEGKTTVAINLARVLAMSGERVMLIEADLRRPSLERHTGVPSNRAGLTNALLQDAPVEDLLVADRTGLENLRILPSGASVPFAAELLRSPKMSEVLDQARELADVVILDTPPLLPVADARSLMRNPSVDGVLLVSRLNAETTEHAKRVRGLLEQHGIQEVLVIATGTPDEPDYGYDSEYSEPEPVRRSTSRAPAEPEPRPEPVRAAAAPGPQPARPAAQPVRPAARPVRPAAQPERRTAPAPLRFPTAKPAEPVPAAAAVSNGNGHSNGAAVTNGNGNGNGNHAAMRPAGTPRVSPLGSPRRPVRPFRPTPQQPPQD
jgi:receptor protein-tyrosine kinase